MAQPAALPTRFTLETGDWYGLSMYPGYGDGPYHSPIRVEAIEPLGQSRFKLDFFNARYATGVQGFVKVLHTLRRARSHLIAEETEVADRTYVVMPLSSGWFSVHFPNVDRTGLFDAQGTLDRAVMARLAG